MDQFILNVALGLPGFLLAIVCHEGAHALMALRYGDDTAKQAGRLTMNPAVHFDLFGTVILPLIGAAMGGVMFGWAKPVPVDTRRFSSIRSGMFWVSFAGPMANIILALFSAILLAFMLTQVGSEFFFYGPFTGMLEHSIMINIILATFNLIPFPPLDGSKMVSSFLDYEQARKYEELQKFSLLFILIIWTTPILGYVIGPAIWMGKAVTSVLIHMMS